MENGEKIALKLQDWDVDERENHETFDVLVQRDHEGNDGLWITLRGAEEYLDVRVEIHEGKPRVALYPVEDEDPKMAIKCISGNLEVE